jgi:hypothetical protein
MPVRTEQIQDYSEHFLIISKEKTLADAQTMLKDMNLATENGTSKHFSEDFARDWYFVVVFERGKSYGIARIEDIISIAKGLPEHLQLASLQFHPTTIISAQHDIRACLDTLLLNPGLAYLVLDQEQEVIALLLNAEAKLFQPLISDSAHDNLIPFPLTDMLDPDPIAKLINTDRTTGGALGANDTCWLDQQTSTSELEEAQVIDPPKLAPPQVTARKPSYINFGFQDITYSNTIKDLPLHQGFEGGHSYRLTVSIRLNADPRFNKDKKQEPIERPSDTTIDLDVALFVRQPTLLRIIDEPLSRLTWATNGCSTKDAVFTLKTEQVAIEQKPTIDIFIYYKLQVLYLACLQITLKPDGELWCEDQVAINWETPSEDRDLMHLLSTQFDILHDFTPRGLNLAVQKHAENNEYLITVFIGQIALPHRISLPVANLSDLLSTVRKKMENLCNDKLYQKGGYSSKGEYSGDYRSNHVYDETGDPLVLETLPSESFESFCQAMAEAGSELCCALFNRSDAGRHIHALIRQTLQEGDIVQIWIDRNANEFVYPWCWLYDEILDQSHSCSVDPKLFWGYRYIIEQRPQFDKLLELKPSELTSKQSPNLKMRIGTFNFEPETVNQKHFFENARKRSGKQLQYKFSDDDRDWQEYLKHCNADVLYFFSHGHSSESLAENTPTSIQLGNGDLSLNELESAIDLNRSSPMVFLNICESAQIFPERAESLVKTFITKGARTVIGTEIPMLPAFADLLSRQFFEKLFYETTVSGQVISSGRILFDLRRQFFDMKNPIGFAYTLYGDATTHLALPLSKTEGTNQYPSSSQLS